MARQPAVKPFMTYYEPETGQAERVFFRTQEENDAYAEGLGFMDVKNISKNKLLQPENNKPIWVSYK